MTDRYICADCKEISQKKRKCPYCEEEMKKVSFSRGFEGWMPYVMAGTASVLLLLSFLFSVPILTWLAFPLIGAGLFFDHLYQKQIDKALKEMM
ncbi:MAG: hypothetical protein KGY76_00395 [Candidatus Thermoplasmatota archaeon]|nr:hypothetical protein [Candidatus Thermoplasmatota archaeon]